jgi:hypothetical protein
MGVPGAGAAQRRRAVGVVAALAVALACLAGPSIAAGSGLRFHNCRGGSPPDGGSNPHDNFYRGIRAHSTSCKYARRVVHGYARNHYDPSTGAPDPSQTTTRWGGWVCHSQFRQGVDNPYETVSCRFEGRIVRFYGAP